MDFYQIEKSASCHDSLRAIESDIQHANMMSTSISRAKGGACLQMKLVYNHLAPIFLFLLQWLDCSCSCLFPSYLNLIHVVIFKVHLDTKQKFPSHGRKASIRQFYALRVMNAFIRQAAEAKKKQKISSARASEIIEVTEEKTPSESPVTVATQSVTGAPGSSSRKRRQPPTPVSSDSLAGSAGIEGAFAEAVPLRSFTPDTVKVSRCRTGLLELYHDDLRLVGVPPSPLGGSVMRDIPSRSDVDFIQNLGFMDLLMRSNSASAEAAILNAEVTFRATQYRKQHTKASRAFEKTSTELDAKISELGILKDKERAEAKRREEDMRMAFEADMIKLRNDLRVSEVRLAASEEKLKMTKEELRSARLKSEKAQADLSKGAEVFEEAFLNSTKFSQIVGEKAFGYLSVGFDACAAQFKEAGYPPEGGSSDFLDVDRALDNLPPDV